MKTFKVTLTEDELKAIIEYHAEKMVSYDITPERSARIHDLTKRLNKDTPEIDNDPRPAVKEDQYAKQDALYAKNTEVKQAEPIAPTPIVDTSTW